MKKLNELLETITAKQAEIDNQGKLDEQLARRIQHKFRLDWNYYSNAMEGNSLTKVETKQLMMDNVTIDGKPFKDVAEMRGHDNEVLEIFKIGKGQVRISEKRIRDMHTAIIHEENPEKKTFIGQWKTNDNYLINYRGETFNFLPFSEVPAAIHDLLNKTNADIDALNNNKKEAKHPALIAFEFHLRYLEIHPFYDGNGRTGRLLLNLLLISFGFPPVILDDKTRESYYRILAEVQGYGLDRKECYAFLAELLIRSQDLVLSAIAGKEIEDDDDWKKDIKLWKQNLNSSDKDVLKRSEDSIYNVYSNSLRPLFIAIFEESKIFDDLFVEKAVYNFIDNHSVLVTNVEFFDAWMEVIQPKKVEEMNEAQKYFEKLTATGIILKSERLRRFQEKYKNVNPSVSSDFLIEISFTGFKHNGTKTFDERIEVLVKFDRFQYAIYQDRSHRNKVMEKLYSENITNQEIQNIIKEIMVKTQNSIERSINPDNDGLPF